MLRVCPALVCPACDQASSGRGYCSDCGLYMIVPDRRPPYIPFLTVGDRVGAVWTASVEAASGRAHPTVLAQPVEAAAGPMRRALADPHLDTRVRPWVESATLHLDGVRRFVDTRSVSDLNQAWVELAPAMAGLRQALEALGVSMDDDACDWSVSPVFNPVDVVFPFTDPDE